MEESKLYFLYSSKQMGHVFVLVLSLSLSFLLADLVVVVLDVRNVNMDVMMIDVYLFL